MGEIERGERARQRETREWGDRERGRDRQRETREWGR